MTSTKFLFSVISGSSGKQPHGSHDQSESMTNRPVTLKSRQFVEPTLRMRESPELRASSPATLLPRGAIESLPVFDEISREQRRENEYRDLKDVANYPSRRSSLSSLENVRDREKRYTVMVNDVSVT